ncbi:MAG: amidohydrolase [Opitutaceae bacterium]|nr:amidohydrolase [Opitutaceae bacterium]
MKLTRREFIAASAAAATVPSVAAASAAAGRIDCQSHLFVPDLLTLMERRTADPRVFTRDGTRYIQMGDWLRKVPPLYTDVANKLAVMDASGIAMTALSINDPGPEWFGADGPAVAQLLNDYIAGLARKHPTRFFGLCVLPTQDIRASLAELDRCVKRLGMKGWLLYTNLAGKFPDEPEFRPLFARAVELDIPVLLHPAKPITTDLVKAYEMTSTLGNMFDNTIALTRLLMSGILDEFPRLKLVCPHLGGTLPYIVGRLDHQVHVLKRGPQNLQRKPSDYVRSIYMDIVSPLPEAMRFALDFSGPDKLLFSSDHPWVQPKEILDPFLSLKLPAATEQKVLSGNARKLFGV